MTTRSGTTTDTTAGWPRLLPPAESLRTAWGKRTTLHPGHGRGYPPPLTVRDVHALLCDGRARFPQVVLLKDGSPVPPKTYTAARRIIGTDVPNFLRLEKVEALLGDGASLQLNDLQEYWPPARELCRALADRTGLETSAVAFLSPPGRGAFVLHQDPVHVVVVQAAGTKRWEVYGPFEGQDSPGPVSAPAGAVPEHRMTLSAGDLCYMPPGRPHRAESEETWSLHVSITSVPRTVRKTLRALFEETIASVPDAELPALWSEGEPDPLPDAVKALVAGVADAATGERSAERGPGAGAGAG
ncbi:cupin domain-containing protein, partial [Streptomyces sp. NPDC032472]|uniref:JmjC domain-containing protein n=1 Tax=Streptomyces sp. NPDC032472 TaxID=3155018 RepID=UPI0033D386EF